MGNLTKLEAVIEKLITLAPNQPEPVYDLAALDAVLGKQDLALQNLRKSLDLSAQRLKTNPTARDLSVEVQKDHRFDGLRNLPAFQKLSCRRTCFKRSTARKCSPRDPDARGHPSCRFRNNRLP